jgi:hypothetical protein
VMLASAAFSNRHLKSTVEGQTREPSIMEVNRESRAVGKKHYTLLTTIPRELCVKSGSWACPRCFYNAWDAVTGYSYSRIYLEEFPNIALFPRQIQHIIQSIISYGYLPDHEPTLGEKGDLHGVNFAVDEFQLQLTGEEEWLRWRSIKDMFNIEKKDIMKIKWLSFQTLPVEGGLLYSFLFTLKGLVKWTTFNEIELYVERNYPSRREKKIKEGAVEFELWGHDKDKCIDRDFARSIGKKMPKTRYTWVTEGAI